MFKCVPTAYAAVRQTFGKFSGISLPGLTFYIPGIQTISLVPNMVQNKTFQLRVKTKDNVFTDLEISVQLQIKPENTEKAFFSLRDPSAQIDTYVQNVVRSKVPTMNLDQLFESQNDIGESVSKHLSERMKNYGYTIVDTLINDISPDPEVAHAMNKINATARLKKAAENEASADYIRQVKRAKADKKRKILQGQGISGQRLAILKGYEKGVEDMAAKLGLTSKDVVDFVMKTQHLDTLESIGTSNNAKTVFLSHQPQGLAAQIGDSMMQAEQA